MIDENLLNKFNQIEDLPVSEEMLGAYLEGNLTPSEVSDIESSTQENDYINELTNSGREYDTGFYISDDSIIDDFDLPSIPDDSFIEFDLAYSSSIAETEELDYPVLNDIDNQYFKKDDYINDNIETPFEDDDSMFDSSDDNDISDYE